MNGTKEVLIPQDGPSFDVQMNQMVRATGQAISGGDIKILVTGPARIVSEHAQERIVDGHVLIGALVKEFNLMPTGPGQVEVDVIEESPIPGGTPQVTQYLFNVR
jgi:hypothetical protein